MIKVSHLSKSFGNQKVIDDLSFEVKPGEIIGFLGPNGAGKTTTMRLLTGFLSPDSGEITINDHSFLSDEISYKKQIGYLPENNPLYKEMLVSEMLDFSAEVKGLRGKDKAEAIDFAVSSTRLQEVYFRPIGELSKGFKQRVGMAIALLSKPPFLILDEPTEGLDPNQRTEIRELITTLSKDRTIILSTHVMQEASALCPRILILNKGKLVADGTKESLSTLLHKEPTYIVELSGKEMESQLKTIKNVQVVALGKQDHKTQFQLINQGKAEVEAEFSKLVWANHWTVWDFHKKEQPLEEIFHTLTDEKEN